MEGSFELTLQIVITVLAGISAQVIAGHLKVPSIVFLLLFGILLGHDCLKVLNPHHLGVGLEVMVALSVAIILFDGGLNLELRDLNRVSGSLRNLVTMGTLVTMIGGGMAAHWLGEFPWSIAFLYASLVVVTGPTVIGPILKQVKVDKQVGTLLEGEGVLIDPVGAILAVVVLDTIINTNANIVEIISGLIIRLAIGAAVGGIGGACLGLLLKNDKFISEDLKNLVVLAVVWGLFGLAQMICSESGLMATVIAGIILRASSVPEERLLIRFKEQLTVLCVSVLFILLAADLSIASIFALGWGGFFTVLVLMFAVRPLNIFLCTWDNGMNWRQKLFIAWIGPRGIISASVASLFAILLTQKGINGGDSIKALVFLTIMMTVILQGLTASKVAQWLKITSSEAKGAVIIGCNPLGRLIGRLFQEQGESVVLIDTDALACQKAEQENLAVFHSSGLDPNVLKEAGIESIGTFIALTNNAQVNLLLAERVQEKFRPPRVLAVFPDDSLDLNCQNKINPAFLNVIAIKTWNNYINDGQVKLVKTILKEADLSTQKANLEKLIANGKLLPLLIKRNKSLYVVEASEEWQATDEIIYLLHEPKQKRPRFLQGDQSSSNSANLVLEKLIVAEELPMIVSLTEPLV